jgi:7 transmembrane receptor (rhodopsin family)
MQKNVNRFKFILQAVSDLLLGVFCMPFTLIGQVLRNFVFGHSMCKIIPYFQGNFYYFYLWKFRKQRLGLGAYSE